MLARVTLASCEGPHRDGIGSSGQRLPTHIREQARNLVLIDLVQLRPAVLPCVQNIFTQQLLRYLGRRLRGDTACLTLIDVHAVFVGSCALRLCAKCG